ncbi:MAG: type I-E CRISPR-associated protein Cse2/CasB, partial [Flavobacterium psychrophilum]
MSEFAQSFIAHLQRLQEHDRGAMATLRRSLSFEPGSYPPAYPY